MYSRIIDDDIHSNNKLLIFQRSILTHIRLVTLIAFKHIIEQKDINEFETVSYF